MNRILFAIAIFYSSLFSTFPACAVSVWVANDGSPILTEYEVSASTTSFPALTAKSSFATGLSQVKEIEFFSNGNLMAADRLQAQAYRPSDGSAIGSLLNLPNQLQDFEFNNSETELYWVYGSDPNRGISRVTRVNPITGQVLGDAGFNPSLTWLDIEVLPFDILYTADTFGNVFTFLPEGGPPRGGFLSNGNVYFDIEINLERKTAFGIEVFTGEIHEFDPFTGQVLNILAFGCPGFGNGHIEFSPTGELVCGSANKLSFIDVDTGLELARVFLETDSLVDFEFAPKPVPIPASAWLFGTTLLGLIGFRKRGKTS